jgi:hypothetical protein
MSIQNENPVKAAVQQGVLAAYAAEGYLTDDGAKDMPMVRERIFAILAPRKVLAWRERTDKAVTRGAMTAAVFPSLAGPDRHAEAEDPQLAQAVWTAIDQSVWSELRTSAAGPLQRLVGAEMGNGYMLVRTQLGADRTSAVYITDDRACIERDLLATEYAALQRKFDAHLAIRELLIMRQPQNGPRYAGGFDKQLKALSSAGHDRLSLAIEASSANGAGDDDDDETDSGSEN